MEITLPNQLTEFVNNEVSAGHYGSATEVISQAVRELQERREQQFQTAEFERLIDAGKATPKRELTPEVWAQIWQAARA